MQNHEKEASPIIDVRIRRDRLVGVVAIAVIGIWILWFMIGINGWLTVHPKDTANLERMGQFGDMFGSLNACFTALAFVAVWWTGRMQREELIMQRMELQLQRIELRSTRATVARQAFESMFFQMLRLARDLHQGISVRVGFHKEPSYGDDALSRLAEACRDLIGRIPGTVLMGSNEEARSTYGQLFDSNVYPSYQAQLGAYFRSLFHIFNLVETQSDLMESERHQYAKLARAQLSSNDLVVLAANSCGQHGEGFRSLIEKYHLLKHYPAGSARDFLLRCYAPEAFE